MTEVIFKHKKLNNQKLLSFGFKNRNNEYAYLCDIAGGQMSMTVVVSPDGKVSAEVIDKSTGEEYILHRVPSAAGSFVGQVKAEYEAVLDEISAKCFDSEVFKSEQAKKVIAYMKATYDDELEYLWQKFPDNAVVRRKDNQKWYAAVLTVSRCKLGFDSDEMVEILDLRIKPENMEITVDNTRFFPGYHMNKKHWYTILLDGSISTEEICGRIEESYQLAKK